MKKNLLFILLFFTFPFALVLGQNIGVGTASPNTKLEIMGDLSLRTTTLNVNNGLNHNLNTSAQKFSYYLISGPTAAFSITGIEGGTDGRIVILANTTTFTMTILDQNGGSLVPNQILTGIGGDLIISSGGSVTLVYNTTDSRWRVSSYNSSTQGFWGINGNTGTNASVNFLGTTDNQNLLFKTNNIPQMVLTSQGRIGINPVTPMGLYYPFHRIEIQDSNGLNSDIVIRTASAQGLNGVPAWVSMKSNGTLQAPASVNWGDYLGESYYYGHDGNSFRLGAVIDVNIDTFPGLSSMPSRFSFFTSQAGASFPQERFRIRHNGEIWFGNLYSALTTEQGGSIEIGGRNQVAGLGSPHIDFHWNNLIEDYNVRVVNSGNRQLDIAFSGGLPGTLVVNGSVMASCGTLICSDTRYKTGIMPISNSLSVVKEINGYYYHWDKEAFPEKGFSDARQIGFLAQEIEKHYPELVITDEKGYKAVDYARLTPVLWEAIKAQQKMIDYQEERIRAIEQQLKLRGSD